MSDFSQFESKMRDQGLASIVIETFRAHYDTVCAGSTCEIPESAIEPVAPDQVMRHESLHTYHDAGVAALASAAVIKLNGGLGTTMGLSGPKSLIEVRPNKTFLDCAIDRLRAARVGANAAIPFVLMNSFSTQDQTAKALESYPDLDIGIPLSFLQHKYPKVDAQTLEPAVWAPDPELEWNPPGHGDLYAALATTGLLDTLIERGIHYVFISNCDNLGADLDLDILGFFATEKYDFLMEVAPRTAMDSKGGHLARSSETGRLLLRELAQCPQQDRASFGDIERYCYFNTNNLWVNLVSLRTLLTHHNSLPLPLIVNRKPIDPRDKLSAQVLQLETAMGSAIALFERTCAVEVSRDRFIPVKSCPDLLGVLSDRFDVDTQSKFTPCANIPALTMDLDEHFYSKVDDLKMRFAFGAPSLRACTHLEIKGDVRFGQNVTLQGDVRIQQDSPDPLVIADNTVLSEANSRIGA